MSVKISLQIIIFFGIGRCRNSQTFRGAGDPFGDDIDDHFFGNGGNLVNLIDDGDEGDEDDEKTTTTMTTSPATALTINVIANGSVVNGNTTTTNTTKKKKKSLNKLVGALNDPKSRIVDTKAANNNDNSSKNNETEVVSASDAEFVVDDNSTDTASASAMAVAAAVTAKTGANMSLTQTKVGKKTVFSKRKDPTYNIVVNHLVDLAKEKGNFVEKTVHNGTDSYSEQKFVSNNGFVVMGADGNSSTEQKGKIGGKNVKIKKKEVVHFQIMGTDDAKWKAAHGR